MKPIGKILKNKRESLGMTLLDMEKRIKIKRQYITMLENNDFDSLPNPDYAVGFIKKYAESVNLNAHHLISEHQDELPQHKMTAKEAKKSLQTHTVQENHLVLPLLMLFAILALICTVLWLASVYLFPHPHQWLASTINPSHNVAVKKEKVQTHKVTEEKEKEKPKKVKEVLRTAVDYKSFDGTTLSYNVKSSQPLKLRIQSMTPTWVQIYNDKNQSYTYQNVTDRSIEIKKNVRTLTLITGNTTEFAVTINGTKVDLPNNADTLITRTYQFNISK